MRCAQDIGRHAYQGLQVVDPDAPDDDDFSAISVPSTKQRRPKRTKAERRAEARDKRRWNQLVEATSAELGMG